jgi:hypothetical protein
MGDSTPPWGVPFVSFLVKFLLSIVSVLHWLCKKLLYHFTMWFGMFWRLSAPRADSKVRLLNAPDISKYTPRVIFLVKEALFQLVYYCCERSVC